jgi:hypothetical protein
MGVAPVHPSRGSYRHERRKASEGRMIDHFENIKREIERDGFLSYETLHYRLNVSRAVLNELVGRGQLCVLSGGQYDLPALRDARVAYWRDKFAEMGL